MDGGGENEGAISAAHHKENAMIRVDVIHRPRGRNTEPHSPVGRIEFEGILVTQQDGSTKMPIRGSEPVAPKVTLHPSLGRPEGELEKLAELIGPYIAGNAICGVFPNDGNGVYEWKK